MILNEDASSRNFKRRYESIYSRYIAAKEAGDSKAAKRYALELKELATLYKKNARNASTDMRKLDLAKYDASHASSPEKKIAKQKTVDALSNKVDRAQLRDRTLTNIKRHPGRYQDTKDISFRMDAESKSSGFKDDLKAALRANSEYFNRADQKYNAALAKQIREGKISTERIDELKRAEDKRRTAINKKPIYNA